MIAQPAVATVCCPSPGCPVVFALEIPISVRTKPMGPDDTHVAYVKVGDWSPATVYEHLSEAHGVRAVEGVGD